jgi:hypothetical protein
MLSKLLSKISDKVLIVTSERDKELYCTVFHHNETSRMDLYCFTTQLFKDLYR